MAQEFVRADVVPLRRAHRVAELTFEAKRRKVVEVDALTRSLEGHMERLATVLEGLDLDYGEEIPAPEELRIFAMGLKQIRGGLRVIVGID